MKPHPFSLFLETFAPKVENKSRQLNQAVWLLETTGTPDAAELKASLDTEFKVLFSDAPTYQRLCEWDRDSALKDPLLKRQLNLLIRAFKQNQIPEALLQKISQKEAALAQTYATFRPVLNGKSLSENDIREILKVENDPMIRKKAWDASKQIGEALALQILALVNLRNQAARSLGYSDFFEMQLELQEVDRSWLLSLLDSFAKASNAAYTQAFHSIETALSIRFKGSKGPWVWSDPFCQEDPLDTCELDHLVDGIDIPGVCLSFYRRMGIDVQPILKRSDLYEKAGKNQHAFCINMDRRGDVRTLNNVKPTIKWLETMLHEFGHAIYELGFEPRLPWLLSEPPHMITTEAMALIAGRQAYRSEALVHLVGQQRPDLMQKADESLRRRELIFSRWVLVMSAFESELYRQPNQDLNRLWWSLVEKYQKIAPPAGREGKADWAAKYHIGLAPVYYFSYLLGEFFASSIQEALQKTYGKKGLDNPEAGRFLQERLFAPGNRMSWSELIRQVTGQSLSYDAWLREFC